VPRVSKSDAFNFSKAGVSRLNAAFGGLSLFFFSRAGASRLKTAYGGIKFSKPALRTAKTLFAVR